LAVAVASLLGFAYGKRLHARGFDIAARIGVSECPLIPVALLLFVTVHVGTSTVLGNPQIGWPLPVFIEYHLTAALWVLKVAFVTFGMSSVTVAGFLQGHRSRWTLLIFSIAAIVTVEGLARHSARPNLGAIEVREVEGVILQTNPSTCAAASVANIARHFGIDATEARMVELLHTTWAGTSPAQMVYGFRALGLEAKKVQYLDRDLAKVNPPAVLLVDVGDEPDAHAVAYMARKGDLFEIWDPGSGRSEVPLGTIQQRWRGRAIEVRQSPDNAK
jgi:predicted double-glycine peptidase